MVERDAVVLELGLSTPVLDESTESVEALLRAAAVVDDDVAPFILAPDGVFIKLGNVITYGKSV